MRCLVTGGAGFIGSRLTKRLFAEGHDVYVIDNLASGNLFDIGFLPIENFFEQSIAEDCSNVFENVKPQWVFHLAALPRVQYSIAEPIKTNKANITGSLNMLEHARKYDVESFVYSSSSSVYGEQDSFPLNEEMRPDPLSPYALQKLAGEEYAKMYYRIHGLHTVSLRYFNVYGPTQRAESAYAAAIPKFSEQMLRGESVTVYGDGGQSRDFTFVEDVVDANIAAAKAGKAAWGNAYNVGCNGESSVNDIIEHLEHFYDIKAKVEHLPPVVESRRTRADISAAGADLGWIPKVEFYQGLSVTAKGIKERFEK